MKRILIVAATTGYQTRMFADAARRLGFEATLATDRCHILEDPWGDRALPVRFDDTQAAAEAIVRAGPFDGIIAVADRPTLIAALAAEKLGLPYNSPASVDAARNKYLARQRFEPLDCRCRNTRESCSIGIPLRPRRADVSLCAQAARSLRQPRCHPRR